MDNFEALEKSMCMELEAIEQKIKGGSEMTDTELKRADTLAHAMKSLLTYKAMKEAEEYEGGMSGRRGRGMDGRYVSRDYGPRSYDYGPRSSYDYMPPYPPRW